MSARPDHQHSSPPALDDGDADPDLLAGEVEADVAHVDVDAFAEEQLEHGDTGADETEAGA